MDRVKSFSIRNVRAGKEDSTYGWRTDSESKIMLGSDEQKLLFIEGIDVVQSETPDSGGEPFATFPAMQVKWNLTVTNKRILLWAPYVPTLLGKVKTKAGYASAGAICFDSIQRIEIDRTPQNFLLNFVSEQTFSSLDTVVIGTREMLESVAKTVCPLWLEVFEGDCHAKEQADLFLERCWDNTPVDDSDLNALVRMRGTLLYASRSNGVSVS